MSRLPKLKVSLPFTHVNDDICDLEQAKHRFNYGDPTLLLMVEGQLIDSYEELVQLAALDPYKDKEFLEVLLLPLVGGG